MKLVIHAHALRNEPLSQAITGHFDERGGTIGRSDTNTLTLPDPERHVSRLQAEVHCSGAAFSIRNVGSANAIEVNGRAVRPGESSPLGTGDRLVIGGYAMHVAASAGGSDFGAGAPVDARTVIGASANEPRTDPRPRARAEPRAPLAAPPATRERGYETTAPRRATGSPDDPFAGLAGGPGANSGDDPFADLMAAPPAPLPPAGTRPTAAPHGRLPDDFDPFADIAPPGPPADAALAGFMGDERDAPARLPDDLGIGDLHGTGAAGASGTSLDEMFGLGSQGAATAAGKDPLGDFLAASPVPEGAPADDLLDLFGEKSGRGPTSPAAPNHTPELSGAYQPPAVRSPAANPPAARTPDMPQAPSPRPAPARPAAPPQPRPLPPPRRSGPAPSGEPSPEALWQAFCEGAGISLPLPDGLNPEMMRVMGRVMHHAVEGTLKLIAVRAAAKQELRAQVTTIQSKNNNPLKFSANAQQALAQLLQPPVRGFMSGPEAVRDAMDDLLGHNIGTMAGTRAALQGMLKRFEPARLEAGLSGKGVIDAVLPMNRRARLWELYVEHYARVQDDAQEDFHELFGKAFVKAYEQQLDRLAAARRKAD